MNTIYDLFAIIGGVGVVLIGISKLFGTLVIEKFKINQTRIIEKDLEFIKNELELKRKKDEKFFYDQYDVYKKLWESLQGLRLFIDALWYEVNKDNLIALAKQLEEAEQAIQRWSIFIEKDDLIEIVNVIGIISQFGEGKKGLSAYLRDEDDRHRSEYHGIITEKIIKEKIEQNRILKEKFDNVLEKIKISFRRRMSGQTEV